MPRFVLPGGGPGLLVKGNIDIDARALVKVPVPGKPGQFASVLTCSWELTNEEIHRYRIKLKPGAPIPNVLVPQVVRSGSKWVIVTAKGALAHFERTGRHLGIFDTAQHATAYGNRLHLQQQAAGRKRRRVRS